MSKILEEANRRVAQFKADNPLSVEQILNTNLVEYYTNLQCRFLDEVRNESLNRVEKICKTCKSDNIVLDAWAEWDSDLQEWVLSDFFDHAFCKDCDGETTIEEKPIPAS